MPADEPFFISIESVHIKSRFLKRTVAVDFYVPLNNIDLEPVSLLLLNDGQNLAEMNFRSLLNGLSGSGQIGPVLCAGIYAGEDRRSEYGTARVKDYEGRGGKRAAAYQQFITEELLPFLYGQYRIDQFSKTVLAGFSMGGLSALDTVWNYPSLFNMAGVFSGSLWWRTKNLHEGYEEEKDRIMHRLIKRGTYQPHLRFYFTTGSLDETADRNNNGIIDSIDDTLGLIKELENKGYKMESDICYINYEDGRHDIATWARAMPQFLLWCFAGR